MGELQESSQHHPANSSTGTWQNALFSEIKKATTQRGGSSSVCNLVAVLNLAPWTQNRILHMRLITGAIVLLLLQIGSSVERMIFDESSGIYVLLRNGPGTIKITSGSTSSSADQYYRATLITMEFSGYINATRRWPAAINTSSWSVMQNTPYDICGVNPSSLGTGICGFNSYCIVDEGGLPQCLCPDGYSH